MMHRQPRRLWTLAVITGLLLALGVLTALRLTVFQAAADEGKQALDKQAIEKVLTDQDDAWNRGDLEGFMKGYWHSPELTFYGGDTPRQGWDETLRRYRQRYQGEGQQAEPLKPSAFVSLLLERYRQQNPAPDREMGHLTFDDLRIEMLGPDSAFVRGRWQLADSKGRHGGLFTLIMRRFPEGWRIVHDHSS